MLILTPVIAEISNNWMFIHRGPQVTVKCILQIIVLNMFSKGTLYCHVNAFSFHPKGKFNLSSGE